MQRGTTHSEETKAKMSIARRKRTISAETAAKISASHMGRKHSDEHRASVSAGLKRYYAERKAEKESNAE